MRGPTSRWSRACTAASRSGGGGWRGDDWWTPLDPELSEIASRTPICVKAEQNFTPVCLPWLNGTVERLNKDVLQVFRAPLMAYALDQHEWPYLLPAVQANLNHTPVQSLAGHAPIEVSTSVNERVIELDNVDAQLEHLRRSLHEIHREVADVEERKRLQDTRSHKGSPVNVDVGDFVLWSRIDQRLPNNKLLGQWVGPLKVLSALPHSFTIEHLVTWRVYNLHASRLKFYADEGLATSEELLELVSSQGMGFQTTQPPAATTICSVNLALDARDKRQRLKSAQANGRGSEMPLASGEFASVHSKGHSPRGMQPALVVGAGTRPQLHEWRYDRRVSRDLREPEEGVHVDIQRGMNGRFRCLLQEEAITLLLFQYIGLKWSVEMKAVLRSLLDSLSDKPWMSGTASVESVRADMMRKFQLFALPDMMKDAGRNPYDEDGDSESQAEEGDKKADKQDIIRRVLVEAHLQRTLAGEGKEPSPLVVVMTDLEFFGPSVSHEAVFACLRFLGVHDDMLDVFRRYTQIPLLFPGFEKPKIIQRGLPVSRMMTMLLAEVELFAMDYLVLVSSDVFLYRSHDDICFFDVDEAKVLRAWSEMQRYAQRVGLKFNEDKSGSIRLYAGASTTTAEVGPAPLPATPIRWGLLELQSNGSVKIRQNEVDAFATEMAGRLAAATSTFAWINVYNKYMFFFLRNFGKPSPIFGLTHVQDALSTLRRIHTLVFPKTNGDALGYLREQIMSRRKGAALAMPAAWVYWPLNLGGLGLFNPFLAIWSVQGSLYTYLGAYHTCVDREWPKLQKDWEWQSPFSTVFKELKQQYDVFAERAESEGFEWIKQCSERERFAYMKSSKVTDKQRDYGRQEPELDSTFTLRSFDEYVNLLPSLMDTRLSTEFNELLSEADEFTPPLYRSALQQEAESLFRSASVSGCLSEWVAFIYSEQVTEEFGTLSFFSRELLPAQLIESIKKKTVTW
ncbi:hypothetical protein ON010_g4737 [Phytophthora cinnamomi]|nr:hypothetical protein ON010_g4737 [Phytophthora cinnamomi]